MAAALAVVLSATAATGAGAAPPQPMTGSYEVSAVPGAPVDQVHGQTCEGMVEGTMRHSKPLRAPFDGWLRVELSRFSGDWDLAVAGTEGALRAFSTEQSAYLEYVDGLELVDIHLRRGEQFSIVVCNVVGGRTAQVDYALRPGRAWPAVKRVRTGTTTHEYVTPAVGAARRWVLCHVGYDAGCVASTPPSYARYVTVTIEDDASPAVAALLYEYYGNTGYPSRHFCTSLDRPAALSPRADWVGVILLNGPCEDGKPAQATRGTATFTWSTHA